MKRYIRKLKIEFIIPEGPRYSGNAFVPAVFAERIKGLAERRRPIDCREAEAAFKLAEPDYLRAVEDRGKRVRGCDGIQRQHADRVIHALLTYVEQKAPPDHRPPITGNHSLAEAMSFAFEIGQREIELAWGRRGRRRQRQVKR